MSTRDKMLANPDRGAPCLECQATSKDCQIEYLDYGHRCCEFCDDNGGGIAHMTEATAPTCQGCGAVAERKSDSSTGSSWWQTIHDDDCPWMLDPNSEAYS